MTALATQEWWRCGNCVFWLKMWMRTKPKNWSSLAGFIVTCRWQCCWSLNLRAVWFWLCLLPLTARLADVHPETVGIPSPCMGCHGPYLRAHGKAGGSHRHRRRQRCLHRSRCLGLGQGGRFRLVAWGYQLPPIATDIHQVAFGHCPSAARATVGCWEGPLALARGQRSCKEMFGGKTSFEDNRTVIRLRHILMPQHLYYLLLMFWLFCQPETGGREMDCRISYPFGGAAVDEFTDLGPADGRRWLTSSIKFRLPGSLAFSPSLGCLFVRGHLAMTKRAFSEIRCLRLFRYVYSFIMFYRTHVIFAFRQRQGWSSINMNNPACEQVGTTNWEFGYASTTKRYRKLKFGWMKDYITQKEIRTKSRLMCVHA